MQSAGPSARTFTTFTCSNSRHAEGGAFSGVRAEALDPCSVEWEGRNGRWASFHQYYHSLAGRQCPRMLSGMGGAVARRLGGGEPMGKEGVRPRNGAPERQLWPDEMKAGFSRPAFYTSGGIVGGA